MALSPCLHGAPSQDKISPDIMHLKPWDIPMELEFVSAREGNDIENPLHLVLPLSKKTAVPKYVRAFLKKTKGLDLKEVYGVRLRDRDNREHKYVYVAMQFAGPADINAFLVKSKLLQVPSPLGKGRMVFWYNKDHFSCLIYMGPDKKAPGPFREMQKWLTQRFHGFSMLVY